MMFWPDNLLSVPLPGVPGLSDTISKLAITRAGTETDLKKENVVELSF